MNKTDNLTFGVFGSTIVAQLNGLALGDPKKVERTVANNDAVVATALAQLAGSTFTPPDQRQPIISALTDLRGRISDIERSTGGAVSSFITAMSAIDKAIPAIKKQPTQVPPVGNGRGDSVTAAAATGASKKPMSATGARN